MKLRKYFKIRVQVWGGGSREFDSVEYETLEAAEAQIARHIRGQDVCYIETFYKGK